MWFESFLSDRNQYVFVKGNSLDHLKITCGVPQRSVNGTLLFLLFIIDTPNTSKNFSTILQMIVTFIMNLKLPRSLVKK